VYEAETLHSENEEDQEGMAIEEAEARG